MKRILVLFVYIFLICCAFIPMGNSIISEGIRVPSPQEYNPASSSNKASINSELSNIAVPMQQNPSTNIYFSTPNQVEFPLNIKKTILNSSRDGYIIGEPIWILVEVKCLSDKHPRSIEIYESADKNLEIINYTSLHITSNINDTFNYLNKVNSNHLANKVLNSFYFNISELKCKQSALYKLCVIPKALGLLDTETIIRIGGNGSLLSDSYYPLEVWARDPDFDVRSDINKLEEEPGKDLPITYIIKYKDGHKIEPRSEMFNISIGGLCRDNNPSIIPCKLSLAFNPPDYVNNSTIFIRFSKSGIYTIPEVKIGNNNNNVYLFQDRITIEELWHKYIAELSLIFLGICTLIGGIFPHIIKYKFWMFSTSVTLSILFIIMVIFLEASFSVIVMISIIFIAIISYILIDWRKSIYGEAPKDSYL